MSGIIFGCIVPHPPVLVPDIGGGREAEIAATTKAMHRLTEQLAARRPEVVLVISPHGALLPKAMGVATAASSRGTLRQWGAPRVDYRFNNDPELVAALHEECKASAIPIGSIGEVDYDLDHGVMVPLYFLVKGMGEASLVPLTFSWLPLSAHFDFGQAIGRAAERVGRRVALVASGDLSHRLLPGAPAGYDPLGKVFDEKLVKAIESYDVPAILGLDEELIERAGECGLRSIVILLGALDGLKAKPQVLSYEGPFGVGYLVAAFEVEGSTEAGEESKGVEAMHPLVRLARETVESFVKLGKVPKPGELTDEMKEKAGVFVSIKEHGELRGCIGTFEPAKRNVAEETIANAISSATRDSRFAPVSEEELPHLTYSVDVLTSPEPIESADQLDPKRYGVIVECGARRGLLLPDLEGVDSAEKQIEICRLKGGIAPDEPVKLYRFEVKRYK